MATKAKSIGTAATSGLRLVVVGQGETRGRRPHLLRLREGLMQELKTVADGQMYLLVEVAVRRFIDTLKAREPGIEVIQVHELEPGPSDEHLLDQRKAKSARTASSAKKSFSPPLAQYVAEKKIALEESIDRETASFARKRASTAAKKASTAKV